MSWSSNNGDDSPWGRNVRKNQNHPTMVLATTIEGMISLTTFKTN